MSRPAENSPNYSGRYFDKHAAAARASAQQIVPFVMSILRPTHIADVGCGSGQWTREFILNGVETAFAFDAHAVPHWEEEANRVEFQKIDLEARPVEFPRVDLVCWLEVAEHLSKSACRRVMRSIIQRADAVLFSCAVPGQGGTGHVSERWLSDWVHEFSACGFTCADVLRPRFWCDEKVSWWYRQNTVIFVKQGSVSSDTIAKLQLPTFGTKNVVHPALFKAKCDYLSQRKDQF